MHALVVVVLYVLEAYKWVIIVMALMSWLIAFNVINRHNDFVGQLWNGLLALTEPVLGPIRRRLPATGGIDISPIIVFLAIIFLQTLITDYFLSPGLRY